MKVFESALSEIYIQPDVITKEMMDMITGLPYTQAQLKALAGYGWDAEAHKAELSSQSHKVEVEIGDDNE